MSNQFDASLISRDPLERDLIAQHEAAVESWMKMPSALANAKFHAVRELERAFNACNRIAWGGVPSDLRQPSSQEAAELLSMLRPEDGEKLVRESRLAAQQRHLVGLMELAERRYLEQVQAEQNELARQEAERLELEEFEAYDAAEKPKRYEAWRASRRS